MANEKFSKLEDKQGRTKGWEIFKSISEILKLKRYIRYI